MTKDDSPPPALPVRDPKGHKGTFGTVAVVGGCAGPRVRMIGAPALSALGALRAGAGLARVLAPAPILSDIIALCPSATGDALPTEPDGQLVTQSAIAAIDRALGAASDSGGPSCSALVLGPGLGTSPASAALALRAIQQTEVPIILDADGLNALADVVEFWRDFRTHAILTPHPGEFRRLAAALKLQGDPADPESRPAACAALASRLGCVVVLKGAGTVVSDGSRTWTCTRGHACLATAGTGDVLAGIIAGLVSQFTRTDPTAQLRALATRKAGLPSPASPSPLDLYDAARLGVQAHAIAGERWATDQGASAGLLASELAALVPAVLEDMRQSPRADA